MIEAERAAKSGKKGGKKKKGKGGKKGKKGKGDKKGKKKKDPTVSTHHTLTHPHPAGRKKSDNQITAQSTFNH